MRGEVKPGNQPEQTPRPVLDHPEVIIDTLKISYRPEYRKLGEDIRQVYEFLVGNGFYTSPALTLMDALDTQAQAYRDEAGERLAGRALDHIYAAYEELVGQHLREAHALCSHLNAILTKYPGLFYAVYDDNSEHELASFWMIVDENDPRRVSFYDTPEGPADERRVRACMVDVTRLPDDVRF